MMLTIILPFFNEEGWIGPTVASLAAQSDDRFRVLLVDNGSTDGGADEAASHAAALEGRFEILSCPTPGKIHALQAGLALVETPLVTTYDADTHYPPDYVNRIITLFESDDQAAAIMAIDLYVPQWGMNWYFYNFLGRRLAARNSLGIALRGKQWCSAAK